MRLFDRVASGSSVLPWEQARPSSVVDTRWRKAANTAIRVVADEAYAYVQERGWRNKDVDDFGALIPPFDLMWIEWRLEPTKQMGVLMRTTRNEDRTHSILAMLIYGSTEDKYVHKLPSVMHAVTGSFEDGLVVTVAEGLMNGEKTDAFNGHFAPAWLAVAWMNCRNLALVTHQTNPKLARKRRKHGAFVGMDYRRIVVNSAYSKRWEASSGVAASRFHTVRGHLATYTPEKPMFGKYVGTFWKPSHVRGNADLGRINHEYHVADRGPR